MRYRDLVVVHNVVEWSGRDDQCSTSTGARSGASAVKAREERIEEARERSTETGSNSWRQQREHCQALVRGCTGLELHS